MRICYDYRTMTNLNVASIFAKDVELYTVESVRSWKTLFRRRNLKKLVFRGHINHIQREYDGCILELVDEGHRRKQGYYMENKDTDTPLLRPWLYELPELN